MGKTCAICGKPSGMYPLCLECFKLKDDGKIEKCDKCGKWHYSKDKCDCEPEKTISKQKENDNPQIHGITCIICGNDSNGKHFCYSCYSKYKKKHLLIKVSEECSKFELLDESYEGVFVCKDGHIVKSKSEREIDNYFFDHDIPHAYEKKKIIDGNELHPDFYLPNLDAYLEHWGYDDSNTEYTKSKKFKLGLYEKAGLTIICTYEKTDTKDIDASLEDKLSRVEQGKINFLEE